MRFIQRFVLALVVGTLVSEELLAEEYLNGIKWDEPAVVVPGETAGAPPSDATVHQMRPFCLTERTLRLGKMLRAGKWKTASWW